MSQVESGTVVIVGYSKQKVVIAADSRENDGQGAYRDEACKITALNNKLIFTASGSTKSILHDSVLWDATREARTALTDTEKRVGEKPGDFLDRVAAKWGTLVANNIATNIRPREALKLSDNQKLVEGLFIGIDELQRLHISHGVIRARIVESVPQIAIDLVKVITLTDTIKFGGFGEDDIFQEFDDGKSQRSKIWRHQVPAYAERHRIKDQDMAKAILLVDLTGISGKERVPDNPEIHLVGGGTDAVELETGGIVHWIQRKDKCPAD